MIEQPLHHEDLVEHARLQAKLRTPICLDESIRPRPDAAAAIELDACRVINIKPGRVGGLLEAVVSTTWPGTEGSPSGSAACSRPGWAGGQPRAGRAPRE
jgi:hypothetical protein